MNSLTKKNIVTNSFPISLLLRSTTSVSPTPAVMLSPPPSIPPPTEAGTVSFSSQPPSSSLNSSVITSSPPPTAAGTVPLSSPPPSSSLNSSAPPLQSLPPVASVAHLPSPALSPQLPTSPPPSSGPASSSHSSTSFPPPPSSSPSPATGSPPPPPPSSSPSPATRTAGSPSPPVPHPPQSPADPPTLTPSLLSPSLKANSPTTTRSPPTYSPPKTASPAAPCPGNRSTRGSPNLSPLPALPRGNTSVNSTNHTTSSSTTGAASGNSGGLKPGDAIAVGTVVVVVVVAVLVALVLVVLGFLVCAVWFAWKRIKRNAELHSVFVPSQNSAMFRSSSPAPGGLESDSMYSQSGPGWINDLKPHPFTFDELCQATNGFSTANVLGKGGFGCVYKGVLQNGNEVAVKQLNIGAGQGECEFRAEVEIISRAHHRHIVSLVGYCISGNQRLLVYVYLPNNTLDYHLHGKGRPVMEWANRVKAAAGAARGIAYLHKDCHPHVIHRDIKSANILLDNDFQALVADFGLAKLVSELSSDTPVSTRVMGTPGYMAPEYAINGELTEKCDVYALGVVLLELITGRKPIIDSQLRGGATLLVDWARPLLTRAIKHGEFDGLVDPRLEKNYAVSEMFEMIKTAAVCTRISADRRPRMSQLVRALDSLEESPDLSNGGHSEVHNSSQQSTILRMFQRMAFGVFDQSQRSQEPLFLCSLI